MDTDGDSAYQQEDHGSSQTNCHDGNNQRREGVDRRGANTHQQRPEREEEQVRTDWLRVRDLKAKNKT